jgi:fucose 4-O-acetylase-like acetyltransferase
MCHVLRQQVANLEWIAFVVCRQKHFANTCVVTTLIRALPFIFRYVAAASPCSQNYYALHLVFLFVGISAREANLSTKMPQDMVSIFFEMYSDMC